MTNTVALTSHTSYIKIRLHLSVVLRRDPILGTSELRTQTPPALKTTPSAICHKTPTGPRLGETLQAAFIRSLAITTQS